MQTIVKLLGRCSQIIRDDISPRVSAPLLSRDKLLLGPKKTRDLEPIIKLSGKVDYVLGKDKVLRNFLLSFLLLGSQNLEQREKFVWNLKLPNCGKCNYNTLA